MGYENTRFVVIGTGHIGTYMRMCYEDMVQGNLRGQVVLAKATPNGLDELQAGFDCPIVVGDNMAALRGMQPHIIILCPPPSQIPAIVENELAPYCAAQRQEGGTLPDIYTFAPSPSVDYFYERLGNDVHTVKVLPNMFHKTAGMDSAYLEANFITFSEAHPWPEANKERLYAFLRPLVNTYEVSEADSVPWLGIRNAAHCLYDMCFAISDAMAARALAYDHRGVAGVMRAALRQEWDDMPPPLTPYSAAALPPPYADFAAKSCVEWVRGLTDFAVADKLPAGAGDIVRRNRVEAYLTTIGLYAREELEQHTKTHATKGGVCEKSGLFFQAECADIYNEALDKLAAGESVEYLWPLWRQKGYACGEAVARHGLTLAGKR